jgi:hypothetical protein
MDSAVLGFGSTAGLLRLGRGGIITGLLMAEKGRWCLFCVTEQLSSSLSPSSLELSPVESEEQSVLLVEVTWR